MPYNLFELPKVNTNSEAIQRRCSAIETQFANADYAEKISYLEHIYLDFAFPGKDHDTINIEIEQKNEAAYTEAEKFLQYALKLFISRCKQNNYNQSPAIYDQLFSYILFIFFSCHEENPEEFTHKVFSLLYEGLQVCIGGVYSAIEEAYLNCMFQDCSGDPVYNRQLFFFKIRLSTRTLIMQQWLTASKKLISPNNEIHIQRWFDLLTRYLNLQINPINVLPEDRFLTLVQPINTKEREFVENWMKMQFFFQYPRLAEQEIVNLIEKAILSLSMVEQQEFSALNELKDLAVTFGLIAPEFTLNPEDESCQSYIIKFQERIYSLPMNEIDLATFKTQLMNVFCSRIRSFFAEQPLPPDLAKYKDISRTNLPIDRHAIRAPLYVDHYSFFSLESAMQHPFYSELDSFFVEPAPNVNCFSMEQSVFDIQEYQPILKILSQLPVEELYALLLAKPVLFASFLPPNQISEWLLFTYNPASLIYLELNKDIVLSLDIYLRTTEIFKLLFITYPQAVERFINNLIATNTLETFINRTKYETIQIKIFFLKYFLDRVESNTINTEQLLMGIINNPYFLDLRGDLVNRLPSSQRQLLTKIIYDKIKTIFEDHINSNEFRTLFSFLKLTHPSLTQNLSSLFSINEIIYLSAFKYISETYLDTFERTEVINHILSQNDARLFSAPYPLFAIALRFCQSNIIHLFSELIVHDETGDCLNRFCTYSNTYITDKISTSMRAASYDIIQNTDSRYYSFLAKIPSLLPTILTAMSVEWLTLDAQQGTREFLNSLGINTVMHSLITHVEHSSRPILIDILKNKILRQWLLEIPNKVSNESSQPLFDFTLDDDEQAEIVYSEVIALFNYIFTPNMSHEEQAAFLHIIFENANPDNMMCWFDFPKSNPIVERDEYIQALLTVVNRDKPTTPLSTAMNRLSTDTISYFISPELLSNLEQYPEKTFHALTLPINHEPLRVFFAIYDLMSWFIDQPLSPDLFKSQGFINAMTRKANILDDQYSDACGLNLIARPFIEENGVYSSKVKAWLESARLALFWQELGQSYEAFSSEFYYRLETNNLLADEFSCVHTLFLLPDLFLRCDYLATLREKIRSDKNFLTFLLDSDINSETEPYPLSLMLRNQGLAVFFLSDPQFSANFVNEIHEVLSRYELSGNKIKHPLLADDRLTLLFSNGYLRNWFLANEQSEMRERIVTSKGFIAALLKQPEDLALNAPLVEIIQHIELINWFCNLSSNNRKLLFTKFADDFVELLLPEPSSPFEESPLANLFSSAVLTKMLFEDSCIITSEMAIEITPVLTRLLNYGFSDRQSYYSFGIKNHSLILAEILLSSYRLFTFLANHDLLNWLFNSEDGIAILKTLFDSLHIKRTSSIFIEFIYKQQGSTTLYELYDLLNDFINRTGIDTNQYEIYSIFQTFNHSSRGFALRY